MAVESQLTRRSFVAGAAAGAVAAGTISVTSALASEAADSSAAADGETTSSVEEKYPWAGPAPEAVTSFDEEVDLSDQFLIIGAGMSGYATATRLSELGAKVTLVAKTESWTGIGGSVFAFNSSLAKSLGVEEVSSDEALPRVFEMMSHNVDERLWNIFYSRSGEAMDWACGICEEEGLTPLISEVEHGSLGEYIGTHNFAGGANCSFTTDKDPNSTNTLPTTIGSPIMDFLPILEKRCTDAGVTISYNTTVTQLIKDDSGRVTGAVAEKDGKVIGYTGARAVVLCTGDYTMDETMLKTLCPMADSDNTFKGFLPYATGDGHKLAVWAGAAMQKTKPHAPMIFSLPVECTMGQSPCALTPEEIRALYEDDPELLQRYQTAKEAIVCLTMSKNNLQLNANGERFNNEHTVMGYEGIQLLHQPGGKVYNIYTANWMDYIPEQAGYIGGPIATHEDYKLFMCPEPGFATLDELAEYNGLPADAVKASVERYNQMCEQGHDDDFLKPAEYLCPIDMDGPFYCIPTYSALLVCLGGVQTDTDLHVLDENDQIIPGLYANGSVAGNFVGNNYTTVFPGLNFGRSMCFGYLLASYLNDNE